MTSRRVLRSLPHMPTPQRCIITIVADRPTMNHHHDFACEADALRALARCALHIAKYISPKKPRHSPKKPSAIPGGSPGGSPGAIPGGSPAQKPGGSPAQIPVGLAQGLPPGPAMGLPLGAAQGIADDVYFIGGQP